MADTRSDVTIPAATWTDLYAATTITPGTAVSIYNKGSQACQIAIAATAPSDNTMGVPLYIGAVGSYAFVNSGESGLWAYCPSHTTRLLVQE